MDRSSRPSGKFVLPLMLVLALALAAGSSSAYASACVRQYCRIVLLANSGVKVYREFKNAPYGGQVDNAIYASWHGRRRVAVNIEEVEQAVYNVGSVPALAGDYVAVAPSNGGGYNGEGRGWSIRRINVRTRRSEQTNPAVLGGASQGICYGGLPEGSPGVTDLVVTTRGTVAWVIGGEAYLPGTDRGSYRVCMMPPSSTTPQVVAMGNSIAPDSLATAGGHLYWTEGATARSVSVP